MKKRLVAFAALAATIAAILGSSAGATDIVAAMNTNRVESITTSSGVITVTGQADDDVSQGEIARTRWYQLVAGKQYAIENGGSFIERKAYDGAALLLTEKDENASLTVDPEDDIDETTANSTAASNASTVGGTVEDLNYFPFMGGSMEIVFEPTSESSFLSNFNENLETLVAGLVGPTRPVMITVVDSNGANRVVVGYAPLGDETDTQAQGIVVAWQASGLSVVGDPAPSDAGSNPGAAIFRTAHIYSAASGTIQYDRRGAKVRITGEPTPYPTLFVKGGVEVRTSLTDANAGFMRAFAFDGQVPMNGSLANCIAHGDVDTVGGYGTIDGWILVYRPAGSGQTTSCVYVPAAIQYGYLRIERVSTNNWSAWYTPWGGSETCFISNCTTGVNLSFTGGAASVFSGFAEAETSECIDWTQGLGSTTKADTFQYKDGNTWKMPDAAVSESLPWPSNSIQGDVAAGVQPSADSRFSMYYFNYGQGDMGYAVFDGSPGSC